MNISLSLYFSLLRRYCLIAVAVGLGPFAAALFDDDDGWGLHPPHPFDQASFEKRARSKNQAGGTRIHTAGFLGNSYLLPVLREGGGIVIDDSFNDNEYGTAEVTLSGTWWAQATREEEQAASADAGLYPDGWSALSERIDIRMPPDEAEIRPAANAIINLADTWWNEETAEEITLQVATWRQRNPNPWTSRVVQFLVPSNQTTLLDQIEQAGNNNDEFVAQFEYTDGHIERITGGERDARLIFCLVNNPSEAIAAGVRVIAAYHDLDLQRRRIVQEISTTNFGTIVHILTQTQATQRKEMSNQKRNAKRPELRKSKK